MLFKKLYAMKRVFQTTLIALALVGCDPTSVMEANIVNLTRVNLSITFASQSLDLSKTLQVQPNGTVLFQEGFSTTGGFLEPSLMAYDSVYITNNANEILKVFKENDPGKNIYNVPEDWIFTEPSERNYQYEYEITDEEIQ